MDLKNGAKSVSRKMFTRIVIAALIIIVFAGLKLFPSANSSNENANKLDVKGALASQTINREFSFPLKDPRGEKIGSITYMIEKAELRDEIIVKGSRATSVPGRAFVILTIKVTNDFKQPVQINTKDYIRLSVNGRDEELLAPDIHNDPVEVQAISTKYTHVGFPINTTDKDITLWVGELNGAKDQISIAF